MPVTLTDTLASAADLLSFTGQSAKADAVREIAAVLAKSKTTTAAGLRKVLARPTPDAPGETASMTVGDVSPFLMQFGRVLKAQGAKSSGTRLLTIISALDALPTLCIEELRAKAATPPKEKKTRSGSLQPQFDIESVAAELNAAESDDAAFNALVSRLAGRGQLNKKQASDLAARYLGAKVNYPTKQEALKAILETRIRRVRFDGHLSQIRR